MLDLAGVTLLDWRREFLWNPPPSADQLLLRLPFGLSPVTSFPLGLVGVPVLANPPPFADQLLLLRLPT